MLSALLNKTFPSILFQLYGSTSPDFASFHSSVTTLLRVVRGHVDLVSLLDQRPVLTPVYFYSFYAFAYGISIGLVVAVLNDAYRTTRQQMYYKATLEAQDYEMVEFMMNRFKLWAGIKKQRPVCSLRFLSYVVSLVLCQSSQRGIEGLNHFFI